jgi:hypothetical protein
MASSILETMTAPVEVSVEEFLDGGERPRVSASSRAPPRRRSFSRACA